jgi:methyl-accepting chemotaxis protein
MQMDETTQQNAALVEEATAAARSMEDQANQLAAAVALFHLDNATAPPARASADAQPAPRRNDTRPAPTPRRAAPVAARKAEAALADGDDWQEF